MSDSQNNDPKVLDHNYDGIQEYDNPLPAWWLITFLGTIIFSFIYWIDAEFANRPTQAQEVQAEIAALQVAQPKTKNLGADEEELKKLAAASSSQEQGKSVFAAKCAVCHGPEGQGTIGPNLTDDYWLHGKGDLVGVLQVVSAGVPDKGMPAWESQLNTDELKAVTVFVVSLQGTNPAQAKAAQGEKVSR